MRKVPAKKTVKAVAAPRGLFKEVSELIDAAHRRVYQQVNSEMLMLNWSIGQRVKTDILKDKRASYGKEVVRKLSLRLVQKYGSGWSERQIWNCVRSAYTFPKTQIVYAVRSQLSWTHIRSLLSVEDSLKREFYLQMCVYEKWSTRVLEERMDSMLFERTALSKKPEKVIRQELSQLAKTGRPSEEVVFRDPYFFDFLGLSDAYSEKDIESAILVELQKFITEIGNDFAFLARQKRITIDGEDYYLDLLFYHRGLRRLVAIDLKLGKFRASDKGQMELYLKWLERHEAKAGEEEPVGLILCADKSDEHIELLMLDNSRIKVAQYFTGLPSKRLLKEKLHKAIAIARQRTDTLALDSGSATKPVRKRKA